MEFNEVSFVHVWREENVYAHYIAKEVIEKLETRDWIENVPQFIVGRINLDKTHHNNSNKNHDNPIIWRI